MEFSTNNLEELALAMSTNNTTSLGAISGMELGGNKSVFSSIDVDQVISEAQECLLNSSIEPIRSSEAPCSFKDILDDICEMDRTLQLQKATSNSLTSLAAVSPIIHRRTGPSSAFYHMPDLTMQQSDYTPECSFTDQPDFLEHLEGWPEYLSSPPSVLNNLQELPQLAPIATPPPRDSPVLEAEPVENPQESQIKFNAPTPAVDLKFEDDQLVASVAPVQVFNNCHFSFSPDTSQPQCAQETESHENIAQFNPPMESNVNFLFIKEPLAVPPKKRPRMQKPQQNFDWARVVPRKTFLQPPEVVVLKPFRTRKVASSHQSYDLSAYFDTSAIKIPMISHQRRGKNANRRKQKLRTIPGADNLIFEVLLPPLTGLKQDGLGADNESHNTDHLYPETEIPELDEIFKRKRRGVSIRRNAQLKTPIMVHQVEKELPTPSLPEEPVLESMSNSDVDSDDAPLTAVKSMKCQNCCKIFKTCRSLTIHLKRCTAVRPIGETSKPIAVAENRSTRKASTQSGSSSSKENVDTKTFEEKLPGVLPPLAKRPVTRSQTKRKAASTSDGASAAKRFQ